MVPATVKKNRHGFTLVELLVVVLIIAILAAIAVPLYLSAQKDAAIKTTRSNMQTLANGEQAYRIKHSGYTEDITQLEEELSKTFGDKSKPYGPGNRFYAVKIAPYTCDPVGNGVAPNTQVPDGSFAVITTSTTPGEADQDGCFIPGISH